MAAIYKKKTAFVKTAFVKTAFVLKPTLQQAFFRNYGTTYSNYSNTRIETEGEAQNIMLSDLYLPIKNQIMRNVQQQHYQANN